MDSYRVVAPHYVAELQVEDNVVKHAAQILQWAVGYSATRAFRYLCKKGYKVQHIARDGKFLPECRNVCEEPLDVQVPKSSV